MQQSPVSIMKFLLCVCVLSVAHFAAAKLDIPPEFKEMLNNLQDTCEKESGVDPAVIDAAKKLDLKPDPKFKCFLKCMMTNMQCLTDDGVFDAETVLSNIPEELKKMGAAEAVHKCKDAKGSDPCDTAYELVLCFSKAAQQMAEVFT